MENTDNKAGQDRKTLGQNRNRGAFQSFVNTISVEILADSVDSDELCYSPFRNRSNLNSTKEIGVKSYE